ncbi:MAG: hypothetical protein R6V23_02415 [Bacteroidales bacterium]
MRKLFVLLLTLTIGLQINANEPVTLVDKNYNSILINESSLSTAPSTEYDLSIMNLQVDLLGIIFFGPQITLDFQFANMIAVGPYVRWHYAGVVYQGIVTDWFSAETTTSLASYSVGGQAKFLIPIGSGQHRPYIVTGFEKSFGSDWEDFGDKYIYEYETNIFHFGAGYRMLTGGSFNLSASIAVGFAQDTKSIGYYEYGEDYTDSYHLESRVIPIIQLMLGWQLGR